MNKRDRQLLEALVAKNGAEHQVVVAMGELAELLSELAKYKRGVGDVWKIMDEVADVGICLDQLRVIFDEDGSKEKMFREYKCARATLRNLKGGRP